MRDGLGGAPALFTGTDINLWREHQSVSFDRLNELVRLVRFAYHLDFASLLPLLILLLLYRLYYAQLDMIPIGTG